MTVGTRGAAHAAAFHDIDTALVTELHHTLMSRHPHKSALGADFEAQLSPAQGFVQGIGQGAQGSQPRSPLR